MPVDNRALDIAARRVGDRWSLRLIGALLDGDRTFTELADEVDGIAPNILSARLRALRHDGLVTARPYARRPVRMRYSLSEPGRRLADALGMLASWGGRDDGRPTAAHHDACGTELELRPWCRTCDRAVDQEPTDDLIWL